jgi:hypothetical protein
MSAGVRTLFAVGARLGVTITTVEAMSNRELQGWVDYFNEVERASGADDDAVDLAQLSDAQKRAMFGGRR